MPPTMPLSAAAITTAEAPKRKSHFRAPGRTMSLARRDPRLRDSIRLDAASEFREAAGGTKQVARLLGVTDRWAREIVSGRAASIVSQFIELLLHVRDPWKLVVLCKVTAYRATMMNDSSTELVRKWREDVEEGIQDAQAIVGELVRARDDVNLLKLERMALVCANTMEALAGRCKELRRSRIDPTEDR